MPSRRGFTLVELMIVLVIIAVLATIVLPSLLTARLSANETAALAVVRQVGQAQLHFVNSGAADMNVNGVGEFGTFGELAGGTAIRAAQGGTDVLRPTLLSPGFRLVDALGHLVRSGYRFRVYLPDDSAAGLPELAGGGASALTDADNAEGLWCIYAWPADYGRSGRRTYFLNQEGALLFTEDADYTGDAPPLVPDAAFVPGGPAGSIRGVPAAGQPGRDGNVWYAAN